MPDNTILAEIVTSGASDQTAHADHLPHGGVPASRTMAETDLGRVQALIAKFNAAASKTNLPPALLAAIASRESRCGRVPPLRPDGFDPGGQAFGIMQVEKTFHPHPAGLPDPKSQAHIDQASGILNEFFAQIRRKFPGEPLARQLLAALAAYNCGPGHVDSVSDPDRQTANQDYSKDTWARAQFYAERWTAAGTPSV
jgi:membrane-bound lytic murein transglycosylase MltF